MGDNKFDGLTTWLGLGQAVAIAAIDFYTNSEDGTLNLSNPLFWVGLSVALLVAVKAYFTNKTAPSTLVK